MKYLSLFSGIGGFELGIKKAYESNLEQQHSGEKSKQEERTQGRLGATNQHNQKFRPPDRSAPLCIGYSEIDKYAIQIYQKHFPNHKNYGDCTKIKPNTLPGFDLLVGGFPCQAFSIAGKRKGFDDTRGTLFFDIARILKAKRPGNFILENVKGLLSHDNGRTFKTIITTLTELGYCVEWQVLNAKNFGVPQNRERVFIVGHLGGIPERKVFPIRENDGSTTNGDKEKEIAKTISARTLNARGTHIQSNQSGLQQIRDIPDNTNSRGRPAHTANPRIRRLTPLECERLMSYPDGWTEDVSDTQRYKTLGNGIVSNVVAEVVKRIWK